MNFFLRFCIQSEDIQSPETRRRCGVLSGGVGIALNLLLFLGKLLAGLLTASIAVTADAFNNLSDAASSVVTLIGFRLAGREADEEHPFGHGRIEYLAGLAVSALILLVGVELAKSSLIKIFRPEPVDFSVLSAVILAVSVGVKLWMFWFNRGLSRAIQSAALSATAADSLSDAVATTTLLLGLLAGHFLNLPLDGWLGLAVALFILRAGWGAAKDTIDPLLGRPMDPELAADIDRIVLSHNYILGIHDLVYHDYGPGRAMMSFHAEVPADGDFLEIHDVIDHIERELKAKHHIETSHRGPAPTGEGNRPGYRPRSHYPRLPHHRRPDPHQSALRRGGALRLSSVRRAGALRPHRGHQEALRPLFPRYPGRPLLCGGAKIAVIYRLFT